MRRAEHQYENSLHPLSLQKLNKNTGGAIEGKTWEPGVDGLIQVPHVYTLIYDLLY